MMSSVLREGLIVLMTGCMIFTGATAYLAEKTLTTVLCSFACYVAYRFARRLDAGM